MINFYRTENKADILEIIQRGKNIGKNYSQAHDLIKNAEETDEAVDALMNKVMKEYLLNAEEALYFILGLSEEVVIDNSDIEQFLEFLGFDFFDQDNINLNDLILKIDEKAENAFIDNEEAADYVYDNRYILPGLFKKSLNLEYLYNIQSLATQLYKYELVITAEFRQLFRNLTTRN